MKVYKTCFIGIPLPNEYHKEFVILTNKLQNCYPSLELALPKIPHITIYYLDEQPQSKLDDIAQNVESVISVIKGVDLKVSTLGFFGDNDPRVLFLKVYYPDILVNFHNQVSKLLNKFFVNDDELPFHPHMTLGRMQTLQAKKEFKDLKGTLEIMLEQISWVFPIKELVLYGIDPTNLTEGHKKLITIPVKE